MIDAPTLSVDAVDETTTDSLDTVATRYDVVIPANHLGIPPFLANGIKAAFLCSDYHAFERLRRMDLAGDLLFKPSAVARLDLLRETRRTLVTARPVRLGAVFGAEDLDEILGGSGLDVAWRGHVLGRAALYDLREGAAIDFGVLSEDTNMDNAKRGPR